MAFDPDVVNIPASPVQEEIKKQDEQQQEESSVNPFLFSFDDDKKEVKFEDFQQGLFKLGFDEETANNIFNIFDTDDSKDVDEEEYNFVLNSMKSAGIEVSEDGITAENLSEYQAKLEEDKKQEEQLIELDMTSLGNMVQNGELPEAQNNALSDLAKELGTQLANATSTLNTITGELIVTTADNQIFKIDANGNRINYTKEQSIVNPDDIEHLNAKYNLGIDFDNPENMTDEQILRLQQAYVLEENAQQLDANYQAMLNYFDTLGVVDEAYDGIKDFLNAGLTREDIENYYNNEKLKQDFLTSVIQNGGSVEINEDNIGTINQLVLTNIQNLETGNDILQYAHDVLNISDEEIETALRDRVAARFASNNICSEEKFDEYFKIAKDENGEYIISSENDMYDGIKISDFYDRYFIQEVASDLYLQSKKIKSGDTLSFEQAYKLSTGVEYNEQLIADVFNTKPVYENVAQQQQSAVVLEQMMAQMSPSEALDYFNQMAETYNDGRTGEDLFNEYYQTMFEKYPDNMQVEHNNISGLTCTGITVEDGYLWQELSFPEDYDQEGFAQALNLYKKTDENGNTRYYQVVNIENNNIVKSNISGEEKEYNMGIEPTTMLYESINKAIRDNNLYLKTIKEDFNEKYGENAFDAILEEYPKMYAEAFGQNELSNKIKEYQEDMDSYSQKLSQTLSIGCFVAGFIPGVNLGIAPILIAAASDNIIDAINIESNNLSAEQKQQQRNQLLLNTALEAGMFLIGMKINGFANTAGNKLTHDLISKGCSFALNHANWTEALIEYGVDNLASIAWDFGKGLATGDFLDENGNFCWDKVGSMILNNLIFNTADLRNGMAFYRSIKAGDSIDLGNGTRFKIDQNDGTVEYTYNNGSKVTIENGRATLTEANSTTYNLTFNKATGSWELPDGTKVDLADSNSIPKSYTVRNGVAEYTTSDGIKVTVPESVIRNLTARGADLDSAIRAQYELFDALNRPIAQTDGTTCIPVSSLNELAQKSGILQALLNEIEPVEGKPGYYRIDKFGDDFEFKLDGETNPLQKIYEMYQASRFGENSEGDYVPNFLTELFGAGNEVRQTLNNDNLPAIREYLNDDDTILVASFDGVEGLSNGHAYRIVSIDETTNRMTVQDTNGTQIEIDAKDYMGKVQIEGMSYGDLPALVDSSLEPRLLGGTTSSLKSGISDYQLSCLKDIDECNNELYSNPTDYQNDIGFQKYLLGNNHNMADIDSVNLAYKSYQLEINNKIVSIFPNGATREQVNAITDMYKAGLDMSDVKYCTEEAVKLITDGKLNIDDLSNLNSVDAIKRFALIADQTNSKNFNKERAILAANKLNDIKGWALFNELVSSGRHNVNDVARIINMGIDNKAKYELYQNFRPYYGRYSDSDKINICQKAYLLGITADDLNKLSMTCSKIDESMLINHIMSKAIGNGQNDLKIKLENCIKDLLQQTNITPEKLKTEFDNYRKICELHDRNGSNLRVEYKDRLQLRLNQTQEKNVRDHINNVNLGGEIKVTDSLGNKFTTNTVGGGHNISNDKAWALNGQGTVSDPYYYTAQVTDDNGNTIYYRLEATTTQQQTTQRAPGEYRLKVLCPDGTYQDIGPKTMSTESEINSMFDAIKNGQIYCYHADIDWYKTGDTTKYTDHNAYFVYNGICYLMGYLDAQYTDPRTVFAQ